MRSKAIFLNMAILLLVSISYCQTTDEKLGTFTDPRDGNVYKWVKIGNQIWMAENLRFKTDSGSWCWENKEENCESRGKLYNWAAAMQASPPGWHLPSDEEWKELEMTLGLKKEQADQEGFRVDKDSLLAGKIKLKEAWPEKYEGNPIIITNETGFSAIKTGLYSNGEFSHDGYTGWWTSDENDTHAWIRHIGFFDNTIGRITNRKEFAFPVRCVKNQERDFPVLTGPCLGQKLPGKIPVKFPFDYMPLGYKLHSAPAFTPDGKEVYFSAMDFSIRYSEKIFVMQMIEGIWLPPQVALFSGNTFDGSPSISRDGRYLFYSSARKTDGEGMNEAGERNIWYVERKGEDWSLPQPLNFQTPGWENGSDISELGNLFFDASDIYKIKFPPDEKHNAERLGNTINSNSTELHPCVAPDERFIVFYSSRPGHYGTEGGDLYISFKNNDGTWKQAINLGEQFNSGHLSTSFPRLSPDGKYFFFLKLVSVPWQCEVFWVSVDVLDDLNK